MNIAILSKSFKKRARRVSIAASVWKTISLTSTKWFRATQTEEKLRRENIQGKQKANLTHRQVGAKVRQTIKELGGTMPENLPTAESIKKLNEKKTRQLK